MKRTMPAVAVASALLAGAAGILWMQSAPLAAQAPAAADPEQLAIHRNLGKAFYENPTTYAQSVVEFQRALALAPDSVRERINLGLALLRAGRTPEAIGELQRVQQQDPSLPHTWFNLGITYKKEGEYDKAIEQFEKMIALAPAEAISQYNLGYLYRVTNRAAEALPYFEAAARLDPNLAGARFQLYNAYRASGRSADAQRELARFQELRRQQTGAAIPEDLDWSFYAEIYEPIERAVAAEEAAEDAAEEWKFTTTPLAAGLDAATARLAALDYNADGRADLLAWSSAGALLFRDGATRVADAALAQIKNARDIVPGDYNNDGFADLAVISAESVSLYANRNGAFEKAAAQLPAGNFSKAAWLDYDRDYDLDLILLGETSALARNNGSAGFSDRTRDFPFVAGRAMDGVVMDLMAYDNAMDLVVSYADRDGVIYRDRMGGKFEAVTFNALPQGGERLIARDWNNDGWTDLAASDFSLVHFFYNREGRLERGEPLQNSAGQLVAADFDSRGRADLLVGETIHRNGGAGPWTAGRSIPWQVSTAALAAADFDRDGRTDIAVVHANGSLSVLRNTMENSRAWLSTRLEGVKNLKLAPGARVEVKAGRMYQKQTYQGVPLTFGLGAAKLIDTVRITWPNGLIQNETKQPVNQHLAYKEAQRLSGSCPMIFTWNGREFEFITDVMGVAPLGASLGDGQYFPVDHDEFIQIPGRALALVDGKYEIRVTEELREVAFFDEVKLMAVDHPANVEIFTNDKFKSPPFPEFRLFGVERRIYPKAARDHRGHDVLARLLRRDAAYPDQFQRDYSGIAERHHLDLDFGDAARENRAVLVLRGWLDWADGSTFRAVSQESSSGLSMPYLQVKNAQGEWQTVIEDMGIPAGKPKTIAVDLSGKFLSGSREVRIVTGMALYWDEIFLSDRNALEDSGAARITLTGIPAESVELRFRGWSRPEIHPERKQPERFDYQQWMPVTMWNPTPGMYTRYGDVRGLLGEMDDKLVLMGSGDEMRFVFSAQDLPPLPLGWRRDFLLKVDGWAKDQDANTAFGTSVEPLPFHGMSQYPYAAAEKFPDDEEHREYRRAYNTRPALRVLRPLAPARASNTSSPAAAMQAAHSTPGGTP